MSELKLRPPKRQDKEAWNKRTSRTRRKDGDGCGTRKFARESQAGLGCAASIATLAAL